MEGYSNLPVCMSGCLLPLDLHNYKVMLHFEHINKKPAEKARNYKPIVLKWFCCEDITV